MKYAQLSAAVIALSLVVRSGVLLLTSDALQRDPDGYRRLATNIVEHGVFGDGDSPTAFRPPLYPLLLTGCVALDDYTRLAIGVLHVFMGVATVALVLLLGRMWGLGRRSAALAALLTACDPILFSQSAQVMTETLATLLTAAGLAALTWAGQRRSVGRQMLVGVTLGLGALCRPTLLLWMLTAGIALTWLVCRRRLQTPSDPGQEQSATGVASYSGVWNLAAFFFATAVVLAPWAIRNQLQFGRPIVTTTHGGYTLLLANNPDFYEWLRSGRWGSVWHADAFNADWDRRKPRDEVAADRAAYAEAWQNIGREPVTFLHASLVRIGRFWSLLPHQVTADESPHRRWARYAVALWYTIEFAAASCGIALLLSSRNKQQHEPIAYHAWLWGVLLIASLTAVHTAYWTDMRMRAPLVPVVALAAAAGCRVAGRSREP